MATAITQKVDPSKKDVLQTGYIGDPPIFKETKAEVLNETEKSEKVCLVEVLKKNLRPLKVNLRSMPSEDRESMFRKLEKADLATLRKFFSEIQEGIVKSILKGDYENLDPDIVAELNAKYKDVSP